MATHGIEKHMTSEFTVRYCFHAHLTLQFYDVLYGLVLDRSEFFLSALALFECGALLKELCWPFQRADMLCTIGWK